MQKTALQHKFDEAGSQLAHLKTLLSHISNEQLGCYVKSLEAVLQASREKERIEEECARNNVKKAVLEDAFAPLYGRVGLPSHPIRKMAALLRLKHGYNLSDERVVAMWAGFEEASHASRSPSARSP